VTSSPAGWRPPPGYVRAPAGYRYPAAGRRGVGSVGLPPPVAVEAVPGTGYAVAIVGVAPSVSGPAVASLVVGIGSILVSLAVAAFGLLGARAGWGPTVAGAFAVLAGLLAVASVVLAQLGRKRLVPGRVVGRGFAVSGISCGLAGLLLTVTAFVIALAVVTTG
jgi:hypothetical protein